MLTWDIFLLTLIWTLPLASCQHWICIRQHFGRVNPQGGVECLSYDGATCLMCPAHLPQLSRIMHSVECSTGLDTAFSEWCREAQRLLLPPMLINLHHMPSQDLHQTPMAQTGIASRDREPIPSCIGPTYFSSLLFYDVHRKHCSKASEASRHPPLQWRNTYPLVGCLPEMPLAHWGGVSLEVEPGLVASAVGEAQERGAAAAGIRCRLQQCAVWFGEVPPTSILHADECCPFRTSVRAVDSTESWMLIDLRRRPPLTSLGGSLSPTPAATPRPPVVVLRRRLLQGGGGGPTIPTLTPTPT
eukprot:EG_transcript_21040